jgi:outer membrane protein with beta-barrel domain
MRGYRVVFAAGLCALAALAAEPAAAQTRFGLKAGVNFAKLTGDNVDSEIGTRTGFLAGGFMEAPIADIVNFQLGAQYSQKGAESETVAGDAKLKLDYLEVPALLVVTVPGSGSTDIRLSLGPTLGFLLKCEGEAAIGFSADCKDNVKKFDLGGLVGAGVSFGMGSGAALLVDGFYNFGFMSIDDSANEDDVKNEVFGISAGILLRD